MSKVRARECQKLIVQVYDANRRLHLVKGSEQLTMSADSKTATQELIFNGVHYTSR